MLRILLKECPDSMVLKLEGRFVEPYVAELDRAWCETAPLMARKQLVLDLSGLSSVDAGGAQVLRGFYRQTQAGLLAASPCSQRLAHYMQAPEWQLEAVG